MAVIGKYVLARRKELGLTQEELAHMMGYRTKSSINKIENGTQDIPLPKVEQLARCLQTTPAYLMGWDTEIELEPMDLSILSERQYKRLKLYYDFLLATGDEDE